MFKLKELRLESGLKRSKVAEDLKINAGTLANYENEIRQAPYEYLIKFAKYYDVSVDYLLGISSDEKPRLQQEHFTADEIQLVNDYRKLSNLGKTRTVEYMELWIDRLNY